MSRFTQPRFDEIEISVFGPGYGECVVVHLGSGDWMVVDSCVDSAGGAVSIEYLSALGIDAASAVKLVVATHWHDDHVRGMERAFRTFREARFACSIALRVRDFLALVMARQSHSETKTGSGVREFGGVLDVLEECRKKDGARGHSLIWAIADRRIWSRRADPANDGVGVEVHALSPADEAVSASMVRLGKLAARARQQNQQLPALSPNHASVVLWVAAGSQRILLGSDLQETGGRFRGWTAILDSSTRQNGLASAFKVPHHGSRSGHQDRVWLELLQENAVAVLTPFQRASVNLPGSADVERILKCCRNAYITAPPTFAGQRRRVVDMPRKSGATLRSGMGHVRLRASGVRDERWRVDLFGTALALKDVAA